MGYYRPYANRRRHRALWFQGQNRQSARRRSGGRHEMGRSSPSAAGRSDPAPHAREAEVRPRFLFARPFRCARARIMRCVSKKTATIHRNLPDGGFVKSDSDLAIEAIHHSGPRRIRTRLSGSSGDLEQCFSTRALSGIDAERDDRVFWFSADQHQRPNARSRIRRASRAESSQNTSEKSSQLRPSLAASFGAAVFEAYH